MQLVSSCNAFYVKSETSILKCCKRKKKLFVVSLNEFADVGDIENICDIYGVLGTIDINGSHFLLVITAVSIVGSFRTEVETIYKINKISAISIDDNNKVDDVQLINNSNALEKIINSHKKVIQFVSDKIQPQQYQKTLLDDVLKMFNENGDFYFSYKHSLTLNTQRYAEKEVLFDKAFWWNKELIKDLPYDSEWSLQVIQGHISQTALNIDVDTLFLFTIISRRSVERAGTRYIKRGVDDDSYVANFVETETILSIFGHQLSFIQIRGSVPIYWSQKGIKYRPPLTIDKSMDKSLPVFLKHFEKLKKRYNTPIVCLNLVDQTGRELCLAKSYLEHFLETEDPDLCFVSFDFHYHCRALKLHKIQDLILSIENELNKIGFCWLDKSGVLLTKQVGVIRTNCVDCLDRTNVVQGAISQVVCLNQARKLGIIGPLTETPQQLIQALQWMWADNGDAISRQYAGTNALKGDITRSGQRKVLGIMKDGYNSASRYYLSQIKDNQKQKVIDMILGKKGTQDDIEIDEEENENIGRLVSETIHFVLPNEEVLVGGFALVSGSTTTDQIDTVLLLSRNAIYISIYDEESEKLLEVKTIPFPNIIAIECGSLSKNGRIHLRIKYKMDPEETTISFVSYRTAKIRLFNNAVIPLKNETDADDYVLAIGEQICMTMTMMGYEQNLQIFNRLNPSSATNVSSPTKIVSKRAIISNALKSIVGIKNNVGQKVDVKDGDTSDIEKTCEEKNEDKEIEELITSSKINLKLGNLKMESPFKEYEKRILASKTQFKIL
ncbi:Phosphatidylinositide phosphatase SAC2 [Strongyloides ratti]|uniref:Phosphatidylinositide phosphatase SAC2 n=1 Tax=Strongyloides ratti TaxID=34506 RepID=A0A090MZB6_STRRB|nr:Phosphatidylinositide phosphatase SAC2 [Strongyloides ratti]CEF68649.1 Phosphatidylinositide phosphatase SAC2 [Strongyloides ratti]